MKARVQRELIFSKAALLVLAVAGLLLIIWIGWILPSDTKGEVNSFEECTAAGNSVQDSYPEVCVTPEGERFVNPGQGL